MRRAGAAGPSERELATLTRCIGQPDNPEVDTLDFTLQPGDLVLFATDGVTRVVRDEELTGILCTAEPKTLRLANLVAMINARGAPNNSTTILIEFHDPQNDE